jgi:hypothetical protein
MMALCHRGLHKLEREGFTVVSIIVTCFFSKPGDPIFTNFHLTIILTSITWEVLDITRKDIVERIEITSGKT